MKPLFDAMPDVEVDVRVKPFGEDWTAIGYLREPRAPRREWAFGEWTRPIHPRDEWELLP